MIKDCSNITHELVPITPLTETVPGNSPLAMDSCVQAMPMLMSLTQLHLQQQQQSQLVPIQIQQTQPTIMSSASPLTSTTIVCIGDASEMDAEHQMQLHDVQQQGHIIPMAPESSNNCLSCLPELPETDDYEQQTECGYEDEDHQPHQVIGDGTTMAN